MLCRVIPYEGTEPYIFLSYCHKDAEQVYPIMEQMAQQGYRIWYDDGNHPGDDWLENIAHHLNDCTVCLAMLSENSAASHNCRNELSFAVECEKSLLAVMLEDFSMPLGMRMQLGTIQHLKYREYSTAAAMLNKLYEATVLSPCKGRLTDNPLREFSNYGNTAQKAQEVKGQSRKQKVDEFVAAEQVAKLSAMEKEDQNNNNETPSGKRKDGARKKRIAIVKPDTKEVKNDTNIETENDKLSKEHPVLTDDCPVQDSCETDNQSAVAEETPTVRVENQQCVMLLHPASAVCYNLNSALIRMGRSEKRCDIVISGNQLLSNYHADIIQYNGRCYLRDAGSANGTFVNGDRLPDGGRVVLEESDIFHLYDEAFQIVYGDFASELKNMEKVIILTNRKNNQSRILTQQRSTLGRDQKITQGLFHDPKVSRNHIDIYWQAGNSYVCDNDSTNGSFLNGRPLVKNAEYVLNDGDVLKIGDTSLDVYITTLRGEEI